MLTTIKIMFDAFERNNIVYCHWKSNEHLDEALNGKTDLDVLFDPKQRSILERVLDECGMKRFRSTPLMQYNAIEDFIGFDQETAKIWHLHTHYRMTLGEKHLKGYTITPWTHYLLRNRYLCSSGIYCTKPEDELAVLFVRISLKLRWRDFCRKIGKDDQVEIKWLKERVNYEKFELAVKNLIGEDSKPIMLKLVRSSLDKKNQFLNLQKFLKKKFKVYTGYSYVSSWSTRTKREIFWLIGSLKRRFGFSSTVANRRVSPSGGCAVSIIGCDGAGKSTTIKYINKEFSKKIDVFEVYFGSGDGSSSLLRKPMKIVAKKIGGKGLGHAVEKEYDNSKSGKSVSLKSRLYSFAKIIWAVTLANEKKKKLHQMTKARNNGLLVLTDRYPQSNMPGCSDGPLLAKYRKSKGLLKKIADWEQSIYETASINPPDLTIKLMVPTDVAIERKPEMTIEEIDLKKKIVMNMNISEQTVVIDTSRSFEITRGEVMREIWNLL